MFILEKKAEWKGAERDEKEKKMGPDKVFEHSRK